MIKLKELRLEKGLSLKKLGEKVGMSESTMSLYEAGKRQPDYQTLSRIADLFNVSVDYLLDREPPKTGKGIKIPVLGRVQAGIPVEATEEILDYEEITPEIASQGEHFGLSVQGNSMEPRIVQGDVVIVRQQTDIDSGDIAVILVNGSDATVKKVVKHDEGITLIPFNVANFEPKFYSNQEIEELPVRILGKVIELRGKF